MQSPFRGVVAKFPAPRARFSAIMPDAMSALVSSSPELVTRTRGAVQRGLDALARRQGPTGSWPADYSGPLFLLPMYVALAYACGRLPVAERRDGMLRALLSSQHANGALGLHFDDERESAFVTVLTYVAVRL